MNTPDSSSPVPFARPAGLSRWLVALALLAAVALGAVATVAGVDRIKPTVPENSIKPGLSAGNPDRHNPSPGA